MRAVSLHGNRWFALSVLLATGAFVLSWVLQDATAFTAIGTTALAGGHLTNISERMKPRPMEGQ